MIVVTHTEPLFTKLIEQDIPPLARWEPVAELMKKYTSGYFTKERLERAIMISSLPRIKLDTVGGAAGGDQDGNNLRIDTAYFKAFKEEKPYYADRVRVTVLHELAHWGCWKAEQEGLASTKDGRAHHNHGDYLSPLSAELQSALDVLSFLTRPRLGAFG
jgi:hypothetical protein